MKTPTNFIPIIGPLYADDLQAKYGDLIYCDPPYSHSQTILYGAQDFRLEDLLLEIDRAKSKGVRVALSIDGHKKSGNLLCDLPIESGLLKMNFI